ncbi:c-type cytochrome domain-containing protein [Cecembia rubra]|uniref:c-type cytochrome domain-containing protein n=1 Tax=Cecembia rubra TaxID=1485585 RepID=UPI002715269B|nr:c-type cytochrome domain-containing protein [Cecembia rubra]
MSFQTRLSAILKNVLIVFHGLTLILAFGHEHLEVPPILEFLGRTHPLVLHFPIALLLLLALVLWNPNITFLENKPFSNNLFLSTLLLTGITVMAGLLLATEEGYEKESFFFHQWTGVTLFWLGTIWYILWSKEIYQTARVISVLTIILIIITGHLGASLTHGDDFLFAPLLKKKNDPKVNLDEALSYDHVIRPILEQKCVSCHKASKQKGDLRLDGVEYILAGGKNGPVIDLNNTEESNLLHRILLPMEDEDHMPPKGKLQLTELEIQIITSWIKESAHFDKKLVHYPEESNLFQLAKNLFVPSEGPNYDFPFAKGITIEKLNNDYRVVQTIYPEAPALRVSFFGKSQFTSKALDELDKISVQLVELNLNNMPLNDEDIKKISRFNNLEKLYLNSTGLSGTTLSSLKNQPKLHSLSLSGNPLKETSIAELGALKQLNNLFLWNSSLSTQNIEQLKTLLPNTKIETGFKDEGERYQLNPPLIQAESNIFNNELEVRLKHPIGSVSIFYTLDNTEPDSSNHLLYQGPLKIQKSTTLRARAFANGWLGSEENTNSFFKASIKPISYQLSYPPHKSYPGNGVETLFDQEKGDEDFGSGKWLGFQDQPLELLIDLGKDQLIESVGFSLLTAEGSYIFPPFQVEIWTKEHQGDWKMIQVDNPEQPEKMGDRKLILLEYPIAGQKPKQIKAILKPVNRLPKWHPGAGQKAWMFIDEVLIN